MLTTHLRTSYPEQIRVLLSGTGTSVMAGYVTPRTESELAALYHWDIHTIHVYTQRLLKAKLVRVVDEIPRRGRPMKVYQAVARTISIPAVAIPENHCKKMTRALFRRVSNSDIHLRRQENADYFVELCRRGEDDISFAMGFAKDQHQRGHTSQYYFPATREQEAQITEILSRAQQEVLEVVKGQTEGERWFFFTHFMPDYGIGS